MKGLNEEELGIAIDVIMRGSPEAYELNGERCTIYVENIEGWLWREITE